MLDMVKVVLASQLLKGTQPRFRRDPYIEIPERTWGASIAIQNQLQLQPIWNSGARAAPARVLRRIIAVDRGTPLALGSSIPQFVKFGNHWSKEPLKKNGGIDELGLGRR